MNSLRVKQHGASVLAHVHQVHQVEVEFGQQRCGRVIPMAHGVAVVLVALTMAELAWYPGQLMVAGEPAASKGVSNSRPSAGCANLSGCNS